VNAGKCVRLALPVLHKYNPLVLIIKIYTYSCIRNLTDYRHITVALMLVASVVVCNVAQRCIGSVISVMVFQLQLQLQY